MAFRQNKIPRQVAATLDEDLAQAFWAWAQAGDYASAPEALRALIRIALASTPQDGAIAAAQIRAFNEVRVWITGEVNKFFLERWNDLQMALSTASSLPQVVQPSQQPIQPPHGGT